MKKLLVFLAILFVSVMSSACINNLAIQELNEKAKSLLEQGNYEEAIKRLESSIDLDGSVFETHYNLAVAYVGVDKFDKAIPELNQAIKLNPASADAYYTLGVAHEGIAEQIKTGEEKAEEVEDSKKETDDTLSPEAAKKVADELQEAINCYSKYLEIGKEVNDKENVELHIKDLNDKIEEYVSKYVAPSVLGGGETNTND